MTKRKWNSTCQSREESSLASIQTQGGIHYVGDTQHIKCTQDELSNCSTNASGSALEYTGGGGFLGPWSLKILNLDPNKRFQVQEDQCEGRTLVNYFPAFYG